MTFKTAVQTSNKSQKTTTTNGMITNVSSKNYVVDFFYKAGASRGKNIIPEFAQALEENEELTLRVVQWLRDCRGGAGERQLYRDILQYMEKINHPSLTKLITKTPIIGRWDDLLVFQTSLYKNIAYDLISMGLNDEHSVGLVKKWLPREKSTKKAIAIQLMQHLGLTAKQYRKMLSSVKTTETFMCSGEWDSIDYNTVPSLASTRYQKAFKTHSPIKYGEYVAKLLTKDSGAKVNVTGLYPYNIIQNVKGYVDSTQSQFINAQWDALPNYVGDAKILPMIDVSGSMDCPLGTPNQTRNTSDITCKDVAISIGMYLATKNTGDFSNVYLTFSGNPTLTTLPSKDLKTNYDFVKYHQIGYDTNIEKAFLEILRVATKNKVKQDDMPEYLLILSDMQFNSSSIQKGSFATAKKHYKDAGYNMPNIIYWNINAYDNVPVRFDTQGTALVSGYSTNIVESILSANLDNATPMTPESVMLEAIMINRYDLK